ncbi:MAG: hypothetical protein PHQ65_15610 [Bacteroidales bacterium]|nr:hypothetical protein [Bacteroidales bacterium]MDD3666692.1 hypothetical protein [Bacteroidales bacterium]
MQTRTPYTTTGTKAAPARGRRVNEFENWISTRQRMKAEGTNRAQETTNRRGGDMRSIGGSKNSFGGGINELSERKNRLPSPVKYISTLVI